MLDHIIKHGGAVGIDGLESVGGRKKVRRGAATTSTTVLEPSWTSTGLGGRRGLGRRPVDRQMVLCLSESIKELDVEFMRHAKSLALARDARKSKLVTRFIAVDSGLVLGTCQGSKTWIWRGMGRTRGGEGGGEEGGGGSDSNF